MKENVRINTPFIKLEQLLKLTGVSATGGEAKNVIINGGAAVNGEICLERGRKLFGGEEVSVKGDDKIYKVMAGRNGYPDDN
ncbi:MAG: RNA-binding S4 domain-containing protein [Oscillospiraceae bacterium]|jgi:ribosome-associated protein|nr:RNA-binding S4 domain-containing protein [Oscillospiraceae bacterium]